MGILGSDEMRLMRKGLVILGGSIFIALGINLFLIPYKVLDGGIIGIALILNYLWALKPGLMIIFLVFQSLSSHGSIIENTFIIVCTG